MGIALLLTGILLAVYSPWAQDALRQKLVDKLNSIPGLEFNVGSLSVKFPLDLDVNDVLIAQNGDTLVAAQKLDANVGLLGLLKGEIDVKNAFLTKGRYQMGNADSVMMIVIKADTIDIKPAVVKLSPMDIDIKDARIAHGSVSLTSRVDTAATSTTTDSNPLIIRAGRIRLEDFTYRMAMLPTIDSLGATVGFGILQGGLIDLKKQTVNIKSFAGTRLDAAYIAPDSAQIAATPVVESTTVSAPWTVEIDSIHFDHSHGLYTTHGLLPQPGLDFAYIEAYDMDIAVRNFYNQATSLVLPIQLTGTERCGVALSANGTFSMDSTLMKFEDFEIQTDAGTLLKADGYLGVGNMMEDPNLPLGLNARGKLAVPDIKLMFPAFKPYLMGVSDKSELTLRAAVEGTAGDIKVGELNAMLNGIVMLKASGNIANAFSPSGPTGHINLYGQIFDAKSIVSTVAKGTGLTIPPMKLNGKVDMCANVIKGSLQATTLEGRLALDATLNSKAEKYNVDLTSDRFPVNAFMKDLGVGLVTMHAKAAGNGFDLFKKSANLDANVQVPLLQYSGYNYTGIGLTASLHDGLAKIDATAKNSDVDAAIEAQGNLDGDKYDWTAKVSGNRIDLQAIKMSKADALLSFNLDADASAQLDENKINANLALRNLEYATEGRNYNISGVTAHFETNDSSTMLTLLNRDFHANVSLPYGLDTISAKFARFTAELDHQMSTKQLHVDSLQKALPQFKMYVGAGSNNFINDILAENRMAIQRLDLVADNDSTIGFKGKVLNFISGQTRIDTIGIGATQLGDRMHVIGTVNNRPGTLDEWAHIKLDMLLRSNQLAIRAAQKNINDSTGYDFGMIASYADSVMNARLFPLNPVIGYKNWKVNFDNYISYNLISKRIDANVKMKSQRSALEIIAEHPLDSVGNATDLNDIIINITDLQLQDWISINPFAPPIAGDLSAKLRVNWDGGESINGNGSVSLSDFYYNRESVGNFVTNLDVSTNASGMIRAKANLLVDGQESITIQGYLNDTTATTPFDLDLDLIKFPLAKANPFLPQDMARLNGTLNGSMCVSGDAKRPEINGEIYFDQAAVKVAMTNTSYAISDVKIPVENNVVKFRDFGISGANENPLLINGTVDMSSFTSPEIDLSLDAKNMMVVNTNSASKNALIYGKGYLDLGAKVKGNMNFMSVNANVTVLSGTNVTYMLASTTSTLQAPSETDMVKFVNFNDSTAVMFADSITDTSMLLSIDASLTIQGGTTVIVDLSSKARDKVQIQPQGTLNYTQAPLSDGRLMGRIDINSGFARYTIPVIGSEKEFTFSPSSYVAFNGDMLNPVLNISATDVVKANVTQEGQNSRLVNFDIILDVTGTLNTMDVKFDLKTNDDITVANELQSMSPEQRANQAMNMLLYNVYTGPGTKANANLAANPLYSFLESQVNNWAANNIKGVDLSFGIDQYNQTTNGSTSTTMNYSYQVSKSLFNDRFKIVVGGNYSTDDNPDENLSQNLINDISFEYYLNEQHTMMLRLFRHTGYESILEGEITQTGVGFVYKRRLNYLSQMLPKFMRPKKHKRVQ